nr:R3-type MYB transcription factor [Cuscuta campestris]
MYKQPQPQQKRKAKKKKMTSSSSQSSVQMSSSHNNINESEVSSMDWELIKMSPQEEDLIHRMHNIVGDRWGLIAGRIPGRTAEEIERC